MKEELCIVILYRIISGERVKYMVTTDLLDLGYAIEYLISKGVCQFYDYDETEGAMRIRKTVSNAVYYGNDIRAFMETHGNALKGIDYEIWQNSEIKEAFRP